MKVVSIQVIPLWHTPNPLEVIEQAARVCYKSKSTSDTSSEDFVRSLIRRGHEAMVEHAVASFTIVCDRGVGNELTRHRMASFAQESTRWCNYAKDRLGSEIQVIKPEFSSIESVLIWEGLVTASEQAYKKLIDNGESPQNARSVLPLCLKTEMVMTCNFREWRHVIRLRSGKTAHPMAIEIALLAHKWFKNHYPVIVEDIV